MIIKDNILINNRIANILSFYFGWNRRFDETCNKSNNTSSTLLRLTVSDLESQEQTPESSTPEVILTVDPPPTDGVSTPKSTENPRWAGSATQPALCAVVCEFVCKYTPDHLGLLSASLLSKSLSGQTLFDFHTKIQFPMCPPASSIAPVSKLEEHFTNEAICKFLMQLKNGCSISLEKVLSDVDPYEFSPSNLPPDMWYFWSGAKRALESGFWMSTGEACEIYSTPLVTCFRKTFEFYEGRASHGQKTNWVMQKYTVTDKLISKPDPRALYEVFMVDESSSGRLSKSQLLEKIMDDVAGPSSMGDDSPDHPTGDFLELDDLAIPLSPSASCTTMTSEEYFDSEALMRELGDDNGSQQIQESKVNPNISVPAKLKQVVVNKTTTTLGSLDSDKEHKPRTGQTSKTGPTSINKPGGTNKTRRMYIYAKL
ncbi:hypothetical protein L2E82_17317 [Cichorium intybus]|uniref:Uncharacterized protein n=1 Tax=Cichorium intybus TaxID=13427 RepID=A0ACB9F7E5_CICIN|nr:hypothetical protein L2E82_17317 [Cichorium intybus]